MLKRLPLALMVLVGCSDGGAGGSDGAADGADGDAVGTDTGDTVFVDLDVGDTIDTIDDARAEVLPPEPGAFGAPCLGNGDCASGLCVEGDAGLVCTRPCDSACPEGWACRGIAFQSDVLFLCLPERDELCRPCTTDLECGASVCLELDGAGACAPRCDPAAAPGAAGACEEGFQCAADATERHDGAFCQPTSRSCTCSVRSSPAERACSVATAAGRCTGVAVCDPAVGWGACSAATPGDEVCNGRDDDCNGDIDDGLDEGAACANEVAGVGRCPGRSVCLGTLGWSCDGPTPTPESCNGVDDDCDGATDEDFKDAAGAFTLATSCGRCGNDCTTRFANGLGRCNGDAAECVVDRCDDGFVLFGGQCVPPIDTTCRACDGDDDCLGGRCVGFEGARVCLMGCDAGACPGGRACGVIDGIERCAPVSGSCACTEATAGAERTCSRDNDAGRCLGNERCDGATWSTCSAATPAVETCNGSDDDCDGVIDEGWDDRGSPCDVGAGICLAHGVRQCDPADPAGPTVCSARPGSPAPETCDGRDESCDGATDEGVARPACALTTGVCAGARQECAGASGFLACSPASYGDAYEVDELSCDGRDNDCDGATDEVDADGDGVVALACGEDDCDDGDALVYPGATEIWDAKDNDCDGLVDEGVIPVGTVIVSEIMREPVADPAGEYLEVTNIGRSPIDLRSWVVSVGGEHAPVALPVRVAPGDVAVLCRVAAAHCDYVYGTALTLDNAGGAITLALAGLDIDRVDLGGDFPSGRALNLDPAQFTAVGNDVLGNWCATPDGNALSEGGLGTPGRLNPSCSGAPAVVSVSPSGGIEHGGDRLRIQGSGFLAASGATLGGGACRDFVVKSDALIECLSPAHAPGDVVVAVTKAGVVGALPAGFRYTGEEVSVITWVDLQWPKTLSVAAGAVSELVFGQVRAQGITEPDGAPPGIAGEVGYGPLGTDPRITPGWVWFGATWNKQFYDNDEFMRSLVIPVRGTYSFTYRFTDDGGTSFMYGDFDPGTADGLGPANLGTVTVF